MQIAVPACTRTLFIRSESRFYSLLFLVLVHAIHLPTQTSTGRFHTTRRQDFHLLSASLSTHVPVPLHTSPPDDLASPMIPAAHYRAAVSAGSHHPSRHQPLSSSLPSSSKMHRTHLSVVSTHFLYRSPASFTANLVALYPCVQRTSSIPYDMISTPGSSKPTC